MGLRAVLGNVLPYVERAANPLPQKAKEILGLSRPELNGYMSLDQLARAITFHPYLSTLEVDMYDSESILYKLRYRSQGPNENAPDSERNLPSVEFSSQGLRSQVKSFVDRDKYSGLAQIIADIFAKTLSKAHYKTHDVRDITEMGIVQNYAQLITLRRALTHEELLALIDSLPDGNTIKQTMKTAYKNIPTSVSGAAKELKLPLRKP